MKAHPSKKTILGTLIAACAAMALLPLVTIAWAGPMPAAPVPEDLRAFGQLAPGKGWLLFGEGLFFMDSEAAGWRDITPAAAAGMRLETAAFLDAAHGWALFYDPTGGPASYLLAFTPDAGASWQLTPLDLPGLGEASSPVSAASMGWRTGLHGWLAFELATGSNFSLGLLYVTADGGVSWQARSLPLGEPAYFVSDQVGWVAGGPAGDGLYRTDDGGLTWQPWPVPEAASSGRQPYYRLPSFDDEGTGLLPVVTVEGEAVSADFFRTEDGGATWTLAERVPLEPDTPPDAALPLSLLAADSFGLAVPNSDRIAQMSGGGLTVRANADGSSAGIVELSMSSLQSGWAKWVRGECVQAAGASDPIQRDCFQEVLLLATTDGGEHWAAVPLPGSPETAQQGGLMESQALGEAGASSESYLGQGFDMCEIRPLGQMQTWWNSSPYSAVNLYIGGSARACSNSILSASYLAQLNAQGWRFIPTWVGPQASCSFYSSRMSSNATTAYNQGLAEAEAALTVAANLGLTPPDKSGTVIYYDLEAYNSGDATCRAAANAFMSGWSAGLHSHGSLSGGYGSSCSSGLSDWASLPNPLDAIWIANWYGSAGSVSYRNTASVWGISCVSDSLWPNHQRLRQYAGGHNETWGGQTFNIDSSVLDGILTVPAGTADLAPPSTPSILAPAEASTLERSSDTWLSWKTNGDSCSIHVWGGSLDLTAPTSCSLYHLGVRAGGAYSWQVTADNDFGSTLGPVWHFKVRPNPPGTLSALGVFSTKVDLSWAPSSDAPSNVDGYAVYADGSLAATVSSVVTSYQVTNLPCATPHSFYVTAVRQGAASNPTNTVSATTTTCAPTNLSPADATILLDRRPAFGWGAVAEAAGYVLQASTSPAFSGLAINQSLSGTTYATPADLAVNTRYYWRVRSTGPFGQGDWSAVLSFTTANPPAVPALVAPASNGLVTDYTPRLDWNDAAVPAGTTFDHYQVQVGTDAALASPLVDENVVASQDDLTFTLQPNAAYYWRVRAFNTLNQASQWSAARLFRTSITVPEAASPVDGAAPLDLRPAFDWNDVVGATGYVLQIARNPGFTTLVTTISTPATAYALTSDLPANLTLYWRLRANGPNGPSLWSPGRSLLMPNPPGVPSLVSPANASLTTDYTPRLDWNNAAVPAGTVFDHYQVQVAADPGFASPAIDQDVAGVTASEFTPAAELSSNTPYYWRVRCHNLAGQRSGWSAARSFRTAISPPAPLAPLDLATPLTLRPSLDWSDVPAAAGYRLQVARDAGFASLLVNVALAGSAYSPTVDLPPAVVLYWRVQTTGPNGPSAWSLAWRLAMPNPPGIPALASPANGGLTVDPRPRLDWRDAVLPAGTTFDHYLIQVAAGSGFDPILLEAEVPGLNASEFVPPAALTANTIYYWRVRSFNTAGQHSSWSAAWSLRTALLPPALTSPAEAEVVLTLRPTFDWEGVPGAAGYRVQVSRNATFTPLMLNAATYDSAYLVPVNFPANALLYWRVQSTGPNGPSLWSPFGSFSMPNPPGTPLLAGPANGGLTTDYTPRLDWRDATVPAGTTFERYQIQVSTEAGFSAPMIDEDVTGLTSSEFVPTADLPVNSRFYWRVRSFNTAGQYSIWSPAWSLRTALTPPALASPADLEAPPALRLTFAWESVPGASGYRIQIGRTPTFSSLVVNRSLAGAFYSLPGDLPANTVLYWRVQALGANGPSLWSPARSLTTPNPPAAPALTAPANGALTADYSPRLDWLDSRLPAGTTFDHYQVQVAADSAFSLIVVEADVPGLAASELTPAEDLPANTVYYWRVRSFNDQGEFGSWSVVWRFRTAVLAPVPIAPADGALLTGLRPTFDWQDVSGASSYTIQIARNPAFSSLVVNAAAPLSRFVPPANLPRGAVLYWRVRANGANGPGLWSAAGSFLIQ